jgi:hypothetical protein
VDGERFDLDLLDEEDPFEIDDQVGGRVLMVPLAPARGGDPRRCRPIGCYEASQALAAQYRKDSR